MASSRRPGGYAGMAVCAALFGLMLSLPVVTEPPRGEALWDVLLGGELALLAALSLVTAESLWNVRPWAYRASRALAGAVVGSILLAALQSLWSSGLWEAMWIAAIAAIVRWGLRPVLEYVRDPHGTLLSAP